MGEQIKREHEQRSILRKRAILASIITAFLVSIIPFVGYAQQQTKNIYSTSQVICEVAKAGFGEWSFKDVLQEGGECGALRDSVDIQKLIGCVGVKTTSVVPESFVQECFDLNDVSDLVVDAQESLIGFTTKNDAKDELERILEKMEGKGWVAAKSGVDMQATFVKDVGEIRWAYISCIEVGGETCVIVQIS